VSDHAEFLGEMETILQSEAPRLSDPTVTELRGLRTLEEREQWYLHVQKANRSGKPAHLPIWQGPACTASAWRPPFKLGENLHGG
jgi:hypothetical protein